MYRLHAHLSTNLPTNLPNDLSAVEPTGAAQCEVSTDTDKVMHTIAAVRKRREKKCRSQFEMERVQSVHMGFGFISIST
jgi:hypothetical protein